LSSQLSTIDLVLEPSDNERLANLCGQFDEHLRQVERSLGVEINNRGNTFQLLGDAGSLRATEDVLRNLYAETSEGVLTPARVHLLLREAGANVIPLPEQVEEDVAIHTKRALIRGRGHNQRNYLKSILQNDISFGVGPAGTGKTYLAVACAVDALERDKVRRIILVRPAVEAGERLGFLPGDLAQKIDPYLRPLFDALYEMMGIEKVNRLIERNVIEVAPLAYMRGRTLNESFVILDEAQNTTIEQMRMFLTRIGFGSTAVINGDITQIDLPRGKTSGLRQVLEILKDVGGISFTFFQSRDVVRHPLVQRIVEAYEVHDRAVTDDRDPDAG
jgi:phosphate starvation-inducible PhoH-like protein